MTDRLPAVRFTAAFKLTVCTTCPRDKAPAEVYTILAAGDRAENLASPDSADAMWRTPRESLRRHVGGPAHLGASRTYVTKRPVTDDNG